MFCSNVCYAAGIEQRIKLVSLEENRKVKGYGYLGCQVSKIGLKVSYIFGQNQHTRNKLLTKSATIRSRLFVVDIF